MGRESAGSLAERDIATKQARLILFQPDLGDTSTIKRVEQFLERGYPLTVLAFRRDRYHRGYEPSWPYILLGRTADGRYWQRLRALVGSARVLFAHRGELAAASVFYARNIDQLVLALIARFLVGRPVPLVYEVLDIPAIFIGRGPVAALFRFVERIGLSRVQALVLSSPGFHRNYFGAVQRYAGDWFLIENRLDRSALDHFARRSVSPAVRNHRSRPYRWTVGYFGLIRGESTFDLMTRLAKRLEGRVLFKFAGVLTTVAEERFRAALAGHTNMVYGGAYENPRDLARLYSEIDFAWAIDLENPDHNSRWLLPCRFYEAGLFGVPCLAVQGFEIGELIERLDVGWTFDYPLEDALVRFFETVGPEQYAAKRDRLSALPTERFVAGADVDALCRKLDGLIT
jgi:succinoglycan biosynthesis protein ExoL